MRSLIGSVAIASALLVAGQDAAAQDSRWAPWLGCWDRVSQDVRDTTEPNDRHDADAVDIEEQSPPRVCVTVTGNNQVTLTTTVPNQPASGQAVIADGIAHPVDEPGCEGDEQAEWSTSGLRLFTRANVTCEDGVPRSISGLALITDDDVWIDIRSFRVRGQLSTRVSRYRRAGEAGRESAGRATLTQAEVKEASTKVSAAVLEAAVVEAGANVRVSRKTLTELADAGVAPRVLDVLVALAYPEHFIVERVNGIARARTGAFSDGSETIDLEEYSITGFYQPAHYYSPFSYTYIGPTQPIYLPGGGGFVGGGSVHLPPATLPPPSGEALAIKGVGYTQIRTNDHQPVSRSAAGSNGPTSTGSLGGSSSSSGAPSSDSNLPSSGTASPSGFSSSGGGGGGGDTGRTAQPR